MHVPRGVLAVCLCSVSSLTWSILVAASAITLPQLSAAQQQGDVATEGYITGVQLPVTFDVNGERVIQKPNTGYGLLSGSKIADMTIPLRDAIQIGAYVQVIGGYDYRRKAATAETILFRDDAGKDLKGMSVIDKGHRLGAGTRLRSRRLSHPHRRSHHNLVQRRSQGPRGRGCEYLASLSRQA